MLPELREHLIQKKSHQAQAVAKGFRRFKVRQRTYPGIVADSESEVKGVVVYPLDEIDFAKLDDYEGLEYERCEIQVYNENLNQMEQVQVYLYKECYVDSITEQSWDLSQLDLNAIFE